MLLAQYVDQEAAMLYPFDLTVSVRNGHQRESLKIAPTSPNKKLVEIRRVKYSEFDSAECRELEIFNNANVAIRTCTLFINHFDEDGMYLDSAGVTLEGGGDTKGEWEPIILAGQSMRYSIDNVEISSGFEVQIYEVQFMNGETWSPEEI